MVAFLKKLELKHKKLVCPSCVFVKVKRRAWCSRGSHGSTWRVTHVNLGDGTSIDHIISAHDGLFPCMDGPHKHSRINCERVFMNHVSTNSFTRIQCFTDGIETLAAERLYEMYVGSFGATLNVWHTENNVFAEKVFCDEVEE